MHLNASELELKKYAYQITQAPTPANLVDIIVLFYILLRKNYFTPVLINDITSSTVSKSS